MPTTTFKSTLSQAPVKLLTVFAAVVLVGGYLLCQKIADERAACEARQAAYNALVAKAPEAIEAEFRKWTLTIAKSGMAEVWSGSTSQLLYIHHVPAVVSNSLFYKGQPEQWIVFAKSETGQMFKIWVWVGDNERFVTSRGFDSANTDQLLEALISDQRMDLVKKLNIPIKPA